MNNIESLTFAEVEESQRTEHTAKKKYNEQDSDVFLCLFTT